jgi:hypothetical protein
LTSVAEGHATTIKNGAKPMRRILLAFLFGSLLTAAAVIAADYRMGVMFMFGGFCCFLAQAATLSSLARARAVAHFLEAVCDSMACRSSSLPASPNASHEAVLKPVASAAAPESPDIADLTSALVNLGMRKAKAETVAHQAVQAGGSFEDMFRRATARVN